MLRASVLFVKFISMNNFNNYFVVHESHSHKGVFKNYSISWTIWRRNTNWLSPNFLLVSYNSSWTTWKLSASFCACFSVYPVLHGREEASVIPILLKHTNTNKKRTFPVVQSSDTEITPGTALGSVVVSCNLNLPRKENDQNFLLSRDGGEQGPAANPSRLYGGST